MSCFLEEANRQTDCILMCHGKCWNYASGLVHGGPGKGIAGLGWVIGGFLEERILPGGPEPQESSSFYDKQLKIFLYIKLLRI